jgi:hypothetical protein
MRAMVTTMTLHRLPDINSSMDMLLILMVMEENVLVHVNLGLLKLWEFPAAVPSGL